MFKYKDKTIFGIYLAIATAAMLALNDVLIKYLLPKLPFYELIFIRSIFIIVSLCIFLIPKKQKASSAMPFTTNASLRFLRAASLAVTGLLFFYAALTIPISSATSIALCFPILLSIFARCFLNEKISTDQVCCLILGFIGSLLIIQPTDFSSLGSNIGALIAAAMSGLAISIYLATTRYLSNTINAIWLTIEAQIFLLSLTLIVFYLGKVDVLIFDLGSDQMRVLFSHWKYPNSTDVLPLMILCLNGVALFFLTVKSYEFAKASVIAPFEFFIIPFTMLFAIVIVREIPNFMQTLGAALVFVALFQIKKYKSA